MSFLGLHKWMSGRWMCFWWN